MSYTKNITDILAGTSIDENDERVVHVREFRDLVMSLALADRMARSTGGRPNAALRKCAMAFKERSVDPHIRDICDRVNSLIFPSGYVAQLMRLLSDIESKLGAAIARSQAMPGHNPAKR